MRFGVGVSTETEADAAISAALAQATADWSGEPPSLAVVFATLHHEGEFGELLCEINRLARPEHLIGTTGESLIARDHEWENDPAVVVWLARFPGASLRSFSLEYESTPDGPAFIGLPDELATPTEPALSDAPTQTGDPSSVSGACTQAFLMLADPFTFPVEPLLARWNQDFPNVPVIGGLASGASRPGQHRLFLGERELTHGAVAVHLSGRFGLDAVVSQGCRPIGKPMVITKAQGQIILELGGRPAWEQLRSTVEGLSPRDRTLARTGLHVGRVVSEYRDRFGRGDFLIRNLLGFAPDTGALAVADLFRAGQTIQFHLRDAASADEDLRALLAGAAGDSTRPVAGALMFSCNGRGRRMFSEADHDIGVLRRQLGPLPTAGFFCNGEIGPIGGSNFVHGFTASLALFRPAD